MTEAPERIWLNTVSESEAWTSSDKETYPNDVCFVRADIHDALVKAADELAEVIVELQDALSEAREGQIVNYGEHALTAYRKARGETQ